MNIITKVKNQSQQSILINFLNTDLIGKFLVRQRKIHEAYYVMCICSTLSNQFEKIYKHAKNRINLTNSSNYVGLH